MAEIGVMKKLTIGGKTYTIPEYSLPIASASTLGGVRVGTGLVIESGTGILSATGTDVTIDSEMSSSSTNPVQNQVIKAYIDQYKGTVTSVRVQATSPVQSSTSTAQSSSLNTTISLANGYGDTKNPYGTKTAHYVLAGPTSGSAAAPSFRALVATDIPDLSGTYLTSYTETDPTVPSWAKAASKPSYTASEVGALPSTTVIPSKTSDLTNDSGFITSYTDEKLKWTASTTTNTYYPLQSTSTATTSTANTLNSISFYQYYNTAGGYRRLILGNTTAYKSTGGAYGTIRLYGAPATYYGDLVPGVLSTSSTGRLTANRTWTLPDQTGTIALTSDIPTVSYPVTSVNTKTGAVTLTASDVGALPSSTVIPTVPTNISAFTNDSGYITSADVPEGASAYTGTISAVGTSASSGTNNGFARGDHVHNITSSTITSALGYTPYDSTNPNGYISSYTDEKLKWTASTTSNTYYPLQSTSTATTSTANTLNGISFYQYYNTAGGYRRLDLGNSTAYKSTGGAYGTIRLYGAAATYYGDLVPGVLGTTSGDGHISANRTWTLPDKTGTIALISDIPTTLPASDVSAWAKAASKPTYTASEVGALASNTTYVSTISTTAGTHSTISSKSGAVSFNVPTKTSHLTNDSGFLTSYTETDPVFSASAAAEITSTDISNWNAKPSTDTNTTYALSGVLSSHKFTSTLTAGGSGSGTSTSDFTLAAGTGITITDDTSNRKMTIACSVSNTDEKVAISAMTIPTSSTSVYYPIVGSDTTASSRQYDASLVYSRSQLNSTLIIGGGNNTTSGTLKIAMGNSTSYFASINTDILTSNRTISLPDKTGTVALTSDITDAKVTIATVSLAGAATETYYPIVGKSSETNATRQYESGFSLDVGQLSDVLIIGQSNGKGGHLRLYNGNAEEYYSQLNSSGAGANVVSSLPSVDGTLLCTGNLGYTTSGNNRAVQQDANGNLYVTQKDDNTNTFKSFYGTCETAAATAAKVVTLSTTTGWQLAAGTTVGVKFTNTNTFSATADSHVTLNVNSTGAKNIYYGSALPTGTNTTAFGRANYINYYMYDGSQWVWLSSSADNNTTYSSKAAADGGTDVSLVTTGEKYTWNSKLSSSSTLDATKLSGTIPTSCYTNTKNSAGTTNKTGTKMFLVAATGQSANPTTYSNSNCYIGTDNCLYSGGTKVVTETPSKATYSQNNVSLTARKMGKVVNIQFQSTYRSWALGWNQILTLGTAYRPTAEVNCLAYDNNSGTTSEVPVILRIQTDGMVNFYFYTARSAAPYGNTTYIVE